jgi:chromosome segregation ATPase
MNSSELDEFLSRAVDRQIAEQRALREALNDLRTAVDALRSRPVEASIDHAALDQRIVHVANEVREATRAEVASLRQELADLRGAVTAQPPPLVLDQPEVDLSPVRDDLATVNANIDGIAQALIDLNAGLREWANGVDEGLTSLVRAMNGVKAIADEARRAATAANESLALEVQPRADDDLDELVDDRLEQVEERIEETGRLAMNIRDRLDEFEQVTSSMRQLPKAIEGTVAQAVRRAMAARAKLDKEAEQAMDETLAAVDEQLDALYDAIGKISGPDDHIRKIELGQIELGSRIESGRRKRSHAPSTARLPDASRAPPRP